MRRLLPAALVAAAVLTVGSSHPVPAGAAPPTARETPTTLSPLPASAVVGRVMAVRGTAPKGTKVALQRRYGSGRFASIGTATAGDTGRGSLTVRLTRGGTTFFRVARGGLYSRARSLSVYQWLDVASQPQEVSSGGTVAANRLVRMGGTAYRGSYTAPPGGTLAVSVATRGLCTKAEAWTGFDDNEEPGPAERQFLNIEDTSGAGAVGSAEASPGQVKRVIIAVAGARGLTFAVQGANRTSGSSTRAVLGSPRVYCNADALPQVAAG